MDAFAREVNLEARVTSAFKQLGCERGCSALAKLHDKVQSPSKYLRRMCKGLEQEAREEEAEAEDQMNEEKAAWTKWASSNNDAAEY